MYEQALRAGLTYHLVVMCFVVPIELGKWGLVQGTGMRYREELLERGVLIAFCER